MKKFNTTGTCFPNKHYMVDISDKVRQIADMVEEGEYFSINRGRQYGKTTTLRALRDYLVDDYVVFSITFEGMTDENFAGAAAFYRYFFQLLNRIAKIKKFNIPTTIKDLIGNALEKNQLDVTAARDVIYDICSVAEKPVVLIIDEVDQSSNHEIFIKFLGMLRSMYLVREDACTFQSVILSSVYDVKNLKLKMRPEEQHQYNSPWNIAVPFDIDMTLSEQGIDNMLQEYVSERDIDFDTAYIAKLIRDYTSGYPFLVSRLCQIIDKKQLSWDKEGLLEAVNLLLNEQNTLFDDMNKKLEDFPKLKEMLKRILYHGNKMSFNYGIKEIELSSRFGYIYNNNGAVAVANRIFEVLLYNKFIAEEESKNII